MDERDRQDLRVREYLNKHPYGEQDENGIDLTQIRRNLALTPTERYLKNQRVAWSVLGLIRAREAYRRQHSIKSP